VDNSDLGEETVDAILSNLSAALVTPTSAGT
jgi:hypothetical protein